MPELREVETMRRGMARWVAGQDIRTVDMHTKDARAIGEDEQRLHLVAVWHEAPCCTPRERAALAWCEALTLLPQTHADDAVYAAVTAEFAPAEIVALTYAIVAINGWNRLAVGLRTPVGDYVSRRGRKSSTAQAGSTDDTNRASAAPTQREH